MGVKFSRDALKGTTKTQGDFNLASKFTLEIDGVLVGGVHQVDGLEHEHEVVEYMDGDDMVTHFRPGRQKPGRITITKDWSSTREFFDWRQSVINGKVDRKSISVIFHADDGTESMRVNLFDCYPTKWKGPALNARNSAHATEMIEVVFERMELK